MAGKSTTDRRTGQEQYANTFGVSVEDIRKDLTSERPIWPLSAYGPGRDAPRQLLEGAVEQSMEEMRVQCYLAIAAGQPQEYAKQEEMQLNQCNQQIQSIMNDLEGARKYILDAQHEPNNRNDIVTKETTSFRGMPAQSNSTSGFGQSSSGFGAGTRALGGSTFGQSSGLGVQRPAFGQVSAPGQGSAFGQPSVLGGASAFGKPPALGGSGTFGQPSALGQNTGFGSATKPAAFGQPSQPGAPSGFGQSSQSGFGQSGFGAAQPSAFAGASQPSGFGQVSQTSSFGQASQPAPSAFGQPSQLAGFGSQQPAQPSTGTAFGQSSQPSGFGGQQPGGSAFGQPTALGTSANKPNPFSASTPSAQQQQSRSNPFGAATQTQQGPSPFNIASQTQASSATNTLASGFGTSTSNTRANATGVRAIPPFGTGYQAQTWHNKRIVQDPNDNMPCYEEMDPDTRKLRITRIWFPDGPEPTQVNNPDALRDIEAPPEAYQGGIEQKLMAIYQQAQRDDFFKDGIVPEIPPRREMIVWDI